MKPLVRTAPKPSEPRTKVLLVRPPTGIKSVRTSDEADRAALRLAIGVIVAIGIVAAVWLTGYLGFRLGFAPLLDVPQLQIDLGSGLVNGTLMLISIPQLIILAGMEQPLWLMLGFVLIAIPGAGLAAAKPRAPGGPRPSSVALVFSYTGAVLGAGNALLIVWWTASVVRVQNFSGLPFHPAEAEAWLASLRTVAGLDAVGVVACAVWAVLVMRLAIPLWLRTLSASASFFALAVVTVAVSASSASVAQLQAHRSEVFLDDGSVHTRLLVGFTPRQIATLRVDEGGAIVELHDRSMMMTIIGSRSIVGMLEDAQQRRDQSLP
jgi:hypothetical protein